MLRNKWAKTQRKTRPDGGPSGRAFETDARGRRGACAPVAGGLVEAADPRGADVEAVGVVLALPAAAAIAVDIVAAVGRVIGNRRADDRTADNGRSETPA